ncbi:MAG: hypothetical protein KJ709_07890 [Nanoarchaeota archaeon]|nr:hypothetical protein [Nanoarchaeota archaeon]
MEPLKDVLDRLHDSDEFREWKEKHPDCFLSTAFILLDEMNTGEWQIGYYGHDRITNFCMGTVIKPEEDQKVFKDPVEKILPLDVDKVIFNADQALEEAKKLQQRKYANKTPQRIVLILQNLKGKQLWNITYISGLETLNMHISSDDGKVMKDRLVSVVDFHKGKKSNE